MEVGQPAAPAPAAAIAAAQAALGAGPHRLHRDARHPVAARAHRAPLCRDIYGLTLDPARVVVTTGSSAGFILAFLALFEPGDRVALANPGYPPYRHILTALGCEPVLIETIARRRAGRSPARRCSPRTARSRSPASLVASPANPTGTMMHADALCAI